MPPESITLDTKCAGCSVPPVAKTPKPWAWSIVRTSYWPMEMPAAVLPFFSWSVGWPLSVRLAGIPILCAVSATLAGPASMPIR